DEAVVVGEVLGEDLHRDRALEDAVGRLVDVRHPARAEALAGFVAPGEGARLHHWLPSTAAPGPIPPAAPPPSLGGVTSSLGGSTVSSSWPLALPLGPDSSPSSGGPGCSACSSAFSWAFSSRSSCFCSFANASSSACSSSASTASCSTSASFSATFCSSASSAALQLETTSESFAAPSFKADFNFALTLPRPSISVLTSATASSASSQLPSSTLARTRSRFELI